MRNLNRATDVLMHDIGRVIYPEIVAGDCTGLHWTALDCTGLHWTALDCTGLHWANILHPLCCKDTRGKSLMLGTGIAL